MERTCPSFPAVLPAGIRSTVGAGAIVRTSADWLVIARWR